MRRDRIMGFGGVNCAVDPGILPKRSASFAVNARVEDGQIRPRYGFRKLRDPQADFTGVFGMAYLQGYDDATEKEEYVTAETVAGNTRFYSTPAGGGAATEIKNGVTNVNVNASEWTFVAFDGEAFFMNPANAKPVFRHDIGNPASLTALDIPDAPTVAPTYVIKYGGGSTPYTQLDYAGINPATEIVYTGAAHATDSVLNSDNSLSIGHDNPDVASSIAIDLAGSTAGAQDYTYNDKFALTLTTQDIGFLLSASSIRPSFITTGATALIPDSVKVSVTSIGGNLRQYLIQFGWSDKVSRSAFASIRWLVLQYTVESSNGSLKNLLKVSPMWEGGIDMTAPIDRSPDVDGLKVGYSYYFSTAGFESGLSPELIIPNSVLAGYAPGGSTLGMEPLGVHLEITATVSGDANVDQIRYYATGAHDDKFHRMGTQTDADLTFDLRATYLEIKRQTEFTPTPFEAVTKFLGSPINAFPYKGALVWLYGQGQQNVKFSGIGLPLRQSSDTDAIDDDSRGATFTLADNSADSPIGGTQVGDSAMIAGKYGVYAMFGDFPAQMTPPRKVSGSFGVAGKYAFCRWKSDEGIPGLAYVSLDGQIYFATPGGFSAQETGDNLPLTEPIRDGLQSLRAWLIDGQPEFGYTDFSEAQLVADEQQEALICVMGRRGFVLRRRDIDGVRSWEPVEWNTGGAKIRYASGSTKRRVRWITSDGFVDENEYDSSSREFIGGLLRDRGRAMPTAKWRSKRMVGNNERLSFVKVYRDDLANAPHIVDYCNRVPLGVDIVVPSGALGARPSHDCQGTEHTLEVRMNEADEPYTRLEMEFSPCSNRREA